MLVRYRADLAAVALVLAVFSIQLGLFFYSDGLTTCYRFRYPVAPSATTITMSMCSSKNR